MSTTTKGLYVFSDGSEDALTALKQLFGSTDSNMHKIDALITALESGKAEVVNKSATIGTSWSGGEPYTQSITVEGIFETDTPMVDLVCSDDFDTATAEEKDWAKIYKITTSAGAITVYAKEPTKTTLNIKMQIVR